MKEEVDDKVKALFNAWNSSRNRELSSTEVAAKVVPAVKRELDVSRRQGWRRGRSVGLTSEWAWSRTGFHPDTVVTLWAEAIAVLPDSRWVYCESLDRYDHKKKSAKIDDRIKNRKRLIEAAAGRGHELLALPQICKLPIAEIWDGETAEIYQRIEDDTYWRAVGYTQGDRNIFLVRGAKPGDTLSDQDRDAALARWTGQKSAQPVATAFDIDTAPVLFVPVPWMQSYGADSQAADAHHAVDPVRWNFAPLDGNLYGHIPGAPEEALQRLGAPANEAIQSRVLVVWTACHPQECIHKVVGWYKAATVRRRPAHLNNRDRPEATYSVQAAARDGVVLAVSDRRLALPASAAEPLDGPFTVTDPSVLAHLRDLVKHPPSGATPSPAPQAGHGGRSGPRQPDIEIRLAVEKAAMDAALGYFSNAQDVSNQNLGWDITVPGGNTTQETYVEVKGLSGPKVRFELTPNEYSALKQHGQRYILFVLTSALDPDANRIHVFTHEGTSDIMVWQTADGQRLNFTEKTGAVVDLE